MTLPNPNNERSGETVAASIRQQRKPVASS